MARRVLRHRAVRGGRTDVALEISLNVEEMRAQIRSINDRKKAAVETIEDTGQGEVLVSKRKKLPHERARRVAVMDPAHPDRKLRDADGKIVYQRKPGARTLHGKAIANIMRVKHGKDPFDYPDHVWGRVNGFVADEVAKAQQIAINTGRHQRRRVRKALTDAAWMLAKAARLHLIQGGLGDKVRPKGGRRTRHTRAREYQAYRRKVELGQWTDKYGLPPPWGIASGRFIGDGRDPKAGFRAQWHRGWHGGRGRR